MNISIWKNIKTLPYDEPVLVLTESGKIYRDVWYDSDFDEFMAETDDKPTHWCYERFELAETCPYYKDER